MANHSIPNESASDYTNASGWGDVQHDSVGFVLRHSPVTRPIVTVAPKAVKDAFLLRPEVWHGDIS